MVEFRQKRQVPRVRIASRPAARLRRTLDARLLDLSLSGARIEHLDILRPGSPCAFELPPEIGSLALSARIVWSSIIGSEQNPEGERRLRYESGLAFAGVTADQQATLASALEKLTSGGAPGNGRLSL